jgi:hypothetical protein
VADANTWPRSRALANPSPTELLGETVRELGRSWREDQGRVVARWRIHLVSSCHIVTESSFLPNH